MKTVKTILERDRFIGAILAELQADGQWLIYEVGDRLPAYIPEIVKNPKLIFSCSGYGFQGALDRLSLVGNVEALFSVGLPSRDRSDATIYYKRASDVYSSDASFIWIAQRVGIDSDLPGFFKLANSF